MSIEYQDTSIRDLITDGVRLRELIPVLNKYLKEHHGCVLMDGVSHGWMVIAPKKPIRQNRLFQHVSLATCLEFALSQHPTPDVDTERRPEPETSYGEIKLWG